MAKCHKHEQSLSNRRAGVAEGDTFNSSAFRASTLRPFSVPVAIGSPPLLSVQRSALSTSAFLVFRELQHFADIPRRLLLRSTANPSADQATSTSKT
jgi:hypothetical protein